MNDAGMNAEIDDPLAQVARWRAQAAAVNRPVEFAVIEALARGAEAQRGQAQQELRRRMAQRWAALEASAPVADTPPPTTPRPGLAALRHLVQALNPRPSAPLPAPGGAPSEPLNAVAAYQATWSRLRAEQRLSQALNQVPAKAGPLNSSQLVHRALLALHEASPAYLDAFMRHIDTLLALEQMSGLGEPAPRAAPSRRSGAKPNLKPNLKPKITPK